MMVLGELTLRCACLFSVYKLLVSICGDTLRDEGEIKTEKSKLVRFPQSARKLKPLLLYYTNRYI